MNHLLLKLIDFSRHQSDLNQSFDEKKNKILSTRSISFHWAHTAIPAYYTIAHMFALPPIESLYSSSNHKGALSFSFSLLSRSHSRHKITDIIDVSSINLLFVALSLGMLKHDQVQMSKNVSKCWNLKKRGLGFLLCIPTHLTHTLSLFSQPFLLPLPTLYPYSHSIQQHTHSYRVKDLFRVLFSSP